MTSNSLVKRHIVWCWAGGFLSVLIPVILAVRLPFCGPDQILHCFCDHVSVLRLACANIVINSVLGLTIALSVLLIPLTLILLSYVKIMRSALQISGAEGRAKAFSTCSSHLLVISVFFLTAVGVYISYRIPGTSADQRIMAAVFQNVFPPLMNPIIYCLRTKEIRDSLLKTLKKSREEDSRRAIWEEDPLSLGPQEDSELEAELMEEELVTPTSPPPLSVNAPPAPTGQDREFWAVIQRAVEYLQLPLPSDPAPPRSRFERGHTGPPAAA
ncbi:olfactory receptor 2A14-like [Amia ocellicauda]|uniref:olfactory receptor 2A14-like n=1 Tax=Amia ocellicauda TaxID=2972642 RepID=UPI003464211A